MLSFIFWAVNLMELVTKCLSWNTCYQSHYCFLSFFLLLIGDLPDGSAVKTLTAMWEMLVQSLGWKDTLEKEMGTHSVFLPEKPHGQKGLGKVQSPRITKELDMPEQLSTSTVSSIGWLVVGKVILRHLQKWMKTLKLLSTHLITQYFP